MNVILIGVGVLIAFVFLMIMGTSGIMFFKMFRIFGRVAETVEQATVEATHAEKKRKALEIVAKQPAGSPAYKCKGCGATVDSTAELSADGKVRCNYCNQWSSIYQ